MQEHPFIESLFYRTIGIASLLAFAGINLFILTQYEGIAIFTATGECLVTTGLLASAGFLFWYVNKTLHTTPVQLLLAVGIQIICMGIGFIIQYQYASGSLFLQRFLLALPLRMTIGLLGWTVLMQWYSIQRNRYMAESFLSPCKEPPAPSSVTYPEEIPDRISVKDGSRIHLLHPADILYIQASGDYLSIFTATGQYIKEQTMKHFDQQFSPIGFVRIHRSYIVNIEQIKRIELFGKETYQVILKNNACIRASSAGYKLLKERLGL